jgi:hypothetical protein
MLVVCTLLYTLMLCASSALYVHCWHLARSLLYYVLVSRRGYNHVQNYESQNGWQEVLVCLSQHSPYGKDWHCTIVYSIVNTTLGVFSYCMNVNLLCICLHCQWASIALNLNFCICFWTRILFNGRYSKEEGISVEEYQTRNFTYLLKWVQVILFFFCFVFWSPCPFWNGN